MKFMLAPEVSSPITAALVKLAATWPIALFPNKSCADFEVVVSGSKVIDAVESTAPFDDRSLTVPVAEAGPGLKKVNRAVSPNEGRKKPSTASAVNGSDCRTPGPLDVPRPTMLGTVLSTRTVAMLDKPAPKMSPRD